MNKCLKCNKETKNNKFCSRSCSNSYTNLYSSNRPKKKQFTCIYCGKNVTRNKNCCYKCRGLGDITLKKAIYVKHHKSSAFALVRARARNVLSYLPQVCNKCGYNKHVEVCHIKPISEFSLDTLISIINDPSNLILLCPNCHWEFDNL